MCLASVFAPKHYGWLYNDPSQIKGLFIKHTGFNIKTQKLTVVVCSDGRAVCLET